MFHPVRQIRYVCQVRVRHIWTFLFSCGLCQRRGFSLCALLLLCGTTRQKTKIMTPNCIDQLAKSSQTGGMEVRRASGRTRSGRLSKTGFVTVTRWFWLRERSAAASSSSCSSSRLDEEQDEVNKTSGQTASFDSSEPRSTNQRMMVWRVCGFIFRSTEMNFSTSSFSCLVCSCSNVWGKKPMNYTAESTNKDNYVVMIECKRSQVAGVKLYLVHWGRQLLAAGQIMIQLFFHLNPSGRVKCSSTEDTIYMKINYIWNDLEIVFL